MAFYIGFILLLTSTSCTYVSIYLVCLLYFAYFGVFIISSNRVVLVFNIKYRLLNAFNKFKLHLYMFFKKLYVLLLLSTTRKVKWKPIFKKSSYFGLYRSNRNQWLNK